MATPPTVSIVVLSYNRPQFLEESLRAIARQSLPPLEVIVVDNASPRSAEIAETVKGFDVRFHPQLENLGFAEGMNVGLRLAKGDFVLLTEDDIVLDEHCLREFVHHCPGMRDLGAATGVMFNRTAGTVRYGGGAVSLGPPFKQSIVDTEERRQEVPTEPTQVGYIPGALVFAERALLTEVGGFRSDFFMYFEDTELCMRLEALGRRLMLIPSAACFHFEPMPSQRNPLVEYHKLKNFLALYALHARPMALLRFLIRYASVDVGRRIASGGSDAKVAARAAGWFVANAPLLWAQRARLRREARAKRG